jgi:MFS family permease
MMFLQYAAPGAVWPMYSKRLEQLHFTPEETAACCATQALATVLAPLIVGHVADRWVAAERCLAVCSLLAGVDLLVLAELHSFAAVFAASLVLWLLIGPTLVLGTAICFTHLPHPERQFGPVRMWGTVSWMAANWVLAVCLWVQGSRQDLSVAFRLGAAVALALAVFALGLPHTPPLRRGGGPAPLAALRLLHGVPFVIFGLCLLGFCVTFSFSSQCTPLLLDRLGMAVDETAATLTLAQLSEVLTLALLPMFLLRLGLRGTMILGLGAWTSALWLLAVGRPLGLVVGSLPFNGLCIGGFLVAGQMFVNRTAGSGLRASAQALVTFVNGAGQFAGHLLVGQLRGPNGENFARVFLVGAVLTSVLFVLFLAAFRDRPGPKSPDLPLASAPEQP